MNERIHFEQEQKNPENELLSMGHIKEVIRTSYDDVELASMNVDLPEDARVAFKAASQYLQMPLIVDDFTSHEVRRKWRSELLENHPDAHAFYEQNGLRANKITSVISFYFLLKDDGFGDPLLDATASEIMNVFVDKEKYPRGYDSIPLEDKKNIAEKTKLLARGMCEAILAANEKGVAV